MIMTGLTPEQFQEVVATSQKLHAFAMYLSDEQRAQRKRDYPSLPDSYGFGIKYIDSCYDSRDSRFWCITFRRGRDGVRFSTNHFACLPPFDGKVPKGWKYDNLYDLCMDYLKGDFKPQKEFYVDLGDK